MAPGREHHDVSIQVIGCGYDRFYVAMLVLLSLTRNRRSFRLGVNFDGTLVANFVQRQLCQMVNGAAFVFGSQIVAFSAIDVVNPAIQDPVYTGGIASLR